MRVMDRFGDVLYNLYGSTEVAWATIATPEDLRDAPGTAGRPPRGTVVKLLDEHGARGRRRARPGRIFVGNEMAFDGYTGGGGKQVVDGLMSSGDVGHFDAAGPAVRRRPRRRDDRLGRRERLPARGRGPARRPRRRSRRSRSSASTDEEFGQRLRAFVVARGRPRRRRPTSSRTTSRRTSPATRCRARSCSSRSCRATRPARSSSASWPRARTDAPAAWSSSTRRPRATSRRSARSGCGRGARRTRASSPAPAVERGIEELFNAYSLGAAVRDGRMLAAARDGIIVGLLEFDRVDATRTMVWKLYVDPDAQSRGIGGLLLERLLQAGDDAGGPRRARRAQRRRGRVLRRVRVRRGRGRGRG